MSNWIVSDRITGEVAYAYGADGPGHLDFYPLETYNHIKEQVIETAVVREVSKVDYLRRFTSDERVGIRQAAKTSPVLEDYLALLELAELVNLDDTDTISAVNMLEQVGLIATGRAAEILA